MRLSGFWPWALSFLAMPVEVTPIGWEPHKAQKQSKAGGLGETPLFLTLTPEKDDSGECQLIGRLNVSS